MPAVPYWDLINNVTLHNTLIKARPTTDCVMDYTRFTSLYTLILHVSRNQITEAALGKKFGASPNKVARCNGERRGSRRLQPSAKQMRFDIEAKCLETNMVRPCHRQCGPIPSAASWWGTWVFLSGEYWNT